MADNQTTLVARLREEGRPEDQHNSVGTMGFSQGPRSALMREAAAEIERLREVLAEAGRQIEYLHERWKPTGSGAAVLARIRGALADGT